MRALMRAGLPARLFGKRVLPMAGEYSVAVLEEGVRDFLARCAPDRALARLRAAVIGALQRRRAARVWVPA